MDFDVEFYKKVLLQNGIPDNPTKVSISDSNAKGNGAASTTKLVTVEFERRESVQLFVKLHTENASHEEFLEGLRLFEKEACFFMEYLPKAKELCKQKGFPDDFMDFYPKCYYADERIVVLENLLGFEIMPNGKRHDFGTAVCALKNLAIHHAISNAVITNLGGINEFLKIYPDFGIGLDSLAFTTMVKDAYENALGTAEIILKENKVPGRDSSMRMLTQFRNLPINELVTDALKCTTDQKPVHVLCHGDYKSNNMMFKRDESSGNILDHKAIDLQCVRAQSPMMDVSFYMYFSVDQSVRENQLHDLLNVYLAEFNNVSKQFGASFEMKFDDIEKEYMSFMDFGFLVALLHVGPGLELLKKVDNEETDMSQMYNTMHKLLFKWMKENPHAGNALANEIVTLVEEHNKLQNRL